VFVDERGQRINGQWTGSPAPVEHDILTGSNADGTVAAGLACSDWTSASADVAAQVGHSDGWALIRARPARCRHGTQRTPTRTAQTRHRVAVPDACTVSPADPSAAHGVSENVEASSNDVVTWEAQ
jgi:hypothetical protein